ncbi:cysteine desulfurase [Candidatus Puniceispirillum marinum]|uniref:Cysteine desulfurase n=1 Tax=Puniceispirillum marinum (strain IMCC1322) TaxID=488538 RepID=D5BNJ3_PUNMI|nr:cysteine desulfurase [Candidatus Puniceispirillum marinum]ADE38260.1 cysteine desulfurase, SufS subfamily [Candidatus Puniceispirillum marinum IMCC1322]
MTDNLALKTAVFDSDAIRADFPILSREIHGKPLVYLDSAASAQKPHQVMDALMSAYTDTYSNVHRGLHFLSEASTDAYEAVRQKVAGFIGAPSPDEIVLTSGATMALNMIAHSWALPRLQAGDEILISIAEHHANIVPWQMVAERTGAVLRAFPMDEDGSFSMQAMTEMTSEKTRIISISHVSNVLGTVYPLAEIAKLAKSVDALFVVDGCQGVVHMPVDVTALGCDFYVFSAHKLYGPNGVGVLWGRSEILADMPPFMGGGDMIDRVTIEKSTYAAPPHRFEAGTPAIAEVIALGAAVDYVESIGMAAIRAHEQDVLSYAHQRLSAVEGLNIIGTAVGKSGVVSFTMDCAHPHDISTIIDRDGVAIRAGHHCAQPLMDYLDVSSTARASVGVYTTKSEFDALATSLEKVVRIFS